MPSSASADHSIITGANFESDTTQETAGPPAAGCPIVYDLISEPPRGAAGPRRQDEEEEGVDCREALLADAGRRGPKRRAAEDGVQFVSCGQTTEVALSGFAEAESAAEVGEFRQDKMSIFAYFPLIFRLFSAYFLPIFRLICYPILVINSSMVPICRFYLIEPTRPGSRFF